LKIKKLLQKFITNWIENKKIITKVYNQLMKQSNGGFIAKHNWTCCNTCGWAEIPDTN